MSRWLCAGAVGAVLSGFAFLLLTGRYSNDGSVVVTVSRDHGLHEGDLFVIAGWLVAMLLLGLLAFDPSGRRRDHQERGAG